MTSDRSRRSGRPTLVIVESPAKARTIAQYLGDGFVVESSIGHVRDLPSTAKEIPARYKKEPWARLGVNVDNDFEPLYIIPESKKEQVKKLRKLLGSADELYLATDEDREGEAIAWHLTQVLKPSVPVRRMVFHEITREAIQKAIDEPRDIDAELVEAQETRRILDRLYGYEVSPVLWKKVRPRLSAGRVQSVAVRLIVDRERSRMRFHSAGFWDLEAELAPPVNGRDVAAATTVHARLVELDGQHIASGRDFDAESGQLAAAGSARLLDGAAATALAETLRPATFQVTRVEERPYTQRPPAPFITSTLQQEAGRKLRFTAQRTMRGAQHLYENGYITYMRTDSTNLSTQAVDAAREQAAALYGADHVPAQARRYATSARAQEAHEAIRPAGEHFRRPDDVRAEIENDAFRLYELIWKRTVASQMKDATGLRTNVRLEAPAEGFGAAMFAASGKVTTFAGFLRAYVEGSDDPDTELEDQERVLPPLRAGDQLSARSVEPKGHETQPPARFTEASLVRELEQRGVGRPSTYASIIQTVQDRGYVFKKGSALVPTFVAFAVTQLLEQHFAEIVSPEFTARMENFLDEVAAGDKDSKPWLSAFYFGGADAVDEDADQVGLRARSARGVEEIDARAISSIALGQDPEGRAIAVRVGRYGPYVQAGDDEPRANVPDDTVPDELTLDRAIELIAEAARGDQVLGMHPDSALPISLKTGRFGPYVQAGENDAEPQRASLWPDMSMETITLEQALLLLSYPKTLGAHPESGIEITAQDGPNGPYLRMEKESRSLRDHDHLQSVELEEAVRILAEPRRARGRAARKALKELGEHPDSGEPLRLLEGRFGPYVTDGTVNASIPRGRNPQTITIDDAVDLIATREERLRAEGKDPRAPKQSRPRARRTQRKRSA